MLIVLSLLYRIELRTFQLLERAIAFDFDRVDSAGKITLNSEPIVKVDAKASRPKFCVIWNTRACQVTYITIVKRDIFRSELRG